MHTKLEELWMDALELRVDQEIVTYLKENHPEYQDILRRKRKLVERHPILIKVLEGDEAVTLDEEEHRALKEYLADRDDMARLEREYHYYYGQSHAFSYGSMLKSIQREINPGGDIARKRKLADMLIEARTSEAEMEFLKKDEEYQKRRKEARRQEKILKQMNPSRELMEQIDLLTCSINDYWSRYSDLIYQYALQDILAFLVER